LIQEMSMTWRYSVGSAYEELAFAESQDAAETMAAYGFLGTAKSILRNSRWRLPKHFRNWRAGERMIAVAAYYRYFQDRAFLAEEFPGQASAIAKIATRFDHNGLLQREQYSNDIARGVYGLHQQTVVWQGLRAMAVVWAASGHHEMAATCRALAARLERGLRRAVAASKRRLPDGSLFVPVALLDGEQPFDPITGSKSGDYWNLVAPYALASGFFPPHAVEARGLLRYMLQHGSRLLGLVRTRAGTDQVYGFNVSRFLADNGVPNQLTLTIYGALAAAMTPGTYVSGEGATVAPVHGSVYRTMTLPPNSGANASFLETLRLTLIHEAVSPAGAPRGLELAFSTPRSWLRDGAEIRVSNAPTSFGLLSYSIKRTSRTVHVTVVPPASPAHTALRLRLPAGERIADVRVGRQRLPFVAATGTIDLSVPRRPIDLLATIVHAK
jgi:hypothetical protein